jgi:hypothetical protein
LELMFSGHIGDDPAQIWAVGRGGADLRRLTSQGNNGLAGWTRLDPVLPAAAPVPPSEQVLDTDTVATRAPVVRLAADESRVAFITSATPADCKHVAVWIPGGESVARFRLPGKCFAQGRGIYDVALAGSRVAWVAKGGTLCGFTLKSATLADPLPLALAASGCRDYSLHGDGDLLVFNDGSRLVRIGTGREECGGNFSRVKVCATLRRGADASPVDSVSAGLIAIRKPGVVTVLDAQGKLGRRFPFAPADVSAARLDGGRLVVGRFGVLEVYDVATGARVLTRPMPTGYRLTDVDGGIAVLLQGGTVILLRLADGRSFTLAPGHEPRVADLEPAGLYYSYATPDGGGRIVYVPRSEVERQLRS